jgi:hypothetical protein
VLAGILLPLLFSFFLFLARREGGWDVHSRSKKPSRGRRGSGVSADEKKEGRREGGRGGGVDMLLSFPALFSSFSWGRWCGC